MTRNEDSNRDVHMTVDGQDFTVRSRPSEPGIYDFNWTNAPHPYGFTSAVSGGGVLDRSDLESTIRDFLSGINPTTGYLD